MARKKIDVANKNVWIISTLAVVLVCLSVIVAHQRSSAPVTDAVTTQPALFDFGNQKIMLNDQELTFVNGSYEISDKVYGQHSASITRTSVNSSDTRAAAILIDSPGGSGTFYYLLGAMRRDGGNVIYSKPVFLGDRIKDLSVNVDNEGAEDNGIITVNYLDRSKNAPMVAEPTEAVMAKYAFQDDGNLIGVLH